MSNTKQNLTTKSIDNKTDIKALAESYGLRFRGKKTTCPFHEDSNPSLSLNTDNTLRCYGCNKHLNPKQFVYEMSLLGYKPKDKVTKEFTGSRSIKKNDNPLHWEIFTTIINNTRPAEDAPELESYLNKRGLNGYACHLLGVRFIAGSKDLGFLFDKFDNKVLQEIGINTFYHNKKYQKQGFILFPYLRGEQVGAIKLRNLEAGDKRVYLALGRIGNKVYNEQAIWENKGELFITEGEIKTISLLSAGYTAIGLPSKDAFKRKNIELALTLNRDKKIILNFDTDAKKEGYTLKRELKREGFKVASLCPPDKDIDELLLETKNIDPYILD